MTMSVGHHHVSPYLWLQNMAPQCPELRLEALGAGRNRAPHHPEAFHELIRGDKLIPQATEFHSAPWSYEKP